MQVTTGATGGAAQTGYRWYVLAILTIAQTCHGIDRAIIGLVLQPVGQEFGLTGAQLGLLAGVAYGVPFALAAIPFGYAVDRYNRKTLMTFALSAWSAATALCGAVTGFWTMLAGRAAVGVAEAGGSPTGMSLLSDYFGTDKRSTAIGIWYLSSGIGTAVAFFVGGWIVVEYGWRWAFIALGAPGLLLALLTAFGLKEPRQQLAQAGGAAPAGESLREALRQLAAKRSYVLTVISMILYFLVAYGALTWIPAYLGRVLQFDPVSIGAAYGLASMGGTLVGTLSGGWVTDYIGKRGSAGFASVPGVIMIACWPFFQAMLMTESITIFIVLSFIGGVGIGAAAPAMFSVTHLVCGSVRRSMAVAVAFFFSNLVGLGIGPVITGALSDMFTAAYGPVGLRYALMVAMTMLLPAGLALYAASRFIEREIEE